MKHKCTKCGHVDDIKPQQAKAAKGRWSGMTKAERSAEMKRVRKKGLKKLESGGGIG